MPDAETPTNTGPPIDIVAVGAHPDDVEIGCGGTLAKLVEQGHRVGIVDLTDGEPTPGSPGPEVRLEEARVAAERLGVHARVTLPLENRRLMDGFDERIELAKVFRRWRPRLVLGIAERTPMASPDHWQARQITDAAVFYSRLTKWDDRFDGLPPHTIAAQMYYSLAFYTLQFPDGENDLVVDIGSTLEAKLASIRAYDTQFPPHKQSIFARVEHLNRALGAAAGFEAGERLTSPRQLGTTDLMASLRLH